MIDSSSIISCHDCGLLQKVTHELSHGVTKCYRCDATLQKLERVAPEKSIQHTLALVITALILFCIANVFPIVELHVAGHQVKTTLYGIVHYLFTHEMLFLGGLVFLTSFGGPLLQILGWLYVFLPANFNRTPPYAPQVYRIVRMTAAWSMLEVLMLGIIVAVVKLSGMGTVIPSIALWTFFVLMFFIAAILSTLDTEMIWEQISPIKQDLELKNSDINEHLTNCHNCHLLCNLKDSHEITCPRCGSAVHKRKPNSMSRCTALLIAAFVMYIPANLLPVMVVTSMGEADAETIMGGIIYLATSGDFPLAVIVFVASMVVPSMKLIILTFLLVTTHYKSQSIMKDRTRLYRLTEFIGRWSMIDIFVTALMAALIQIQGLAIIEVGFGAVAFGSVVVLTMLAAMSFDPRLIWDNLENKK